MDVLYLKHFNVSDGQDEAFGAKEKAIFSNIIYLIPVPAYSIQPIATLPGLFLFLQELVCLHCYSIICNI